MSGPLTRRAALLAGAAAFAGGPAAVQAQAQAAPSREAVLQAMRRATRFMTDKVAFNGGCV